MTIKSFIKLSILSLMMYIFFMMTKALVGFEATVIIMLVTLKIQLWVAVMEPKTHPTTESVLIFGEMNKKPKRKGKK